MTKTDAYRIVLNDILNNGCEMFVGKYDAKMVAHSSCMVLV